MSKNELEGQWALILGASSGFGAATARALAGAGMNIFGVHLDLRATLPRARQVVADVEALGRKAVFFNTNAADARKRARVLDQIEEKLADDPASNVHFVLHSLAFGTLLPLIADKEANHQGGDNQVQAVGASLPQRPIGYPFDRHAYSCCQGHRAYNGHRQDDPRRYASSQTQQEGSDEEPDVGADHENVAVGKVDQQ